MKNILPIVSKGTLEKLIRDIEKSNMADFATETAKLLKDENPHLGFYLGKLVRKSASNEALSTGLTMYSLLRNQAIADNLLEELNV